MDSLHDSIVTLFLELSPVLKNVFIFLFAFGEGLPIIGTFLPGGTIALLVGALAEEGAIHAWTAIHIIAIGSILGDLTGFHLGRMSLHFKWVRDIVYSEKQAKNWDLFDRHAAIVIIFGKLVPVVRSTPALLAGARKMNAYKYAGYALIGSYVWAIAGIFGGKYLSQLFGDALLPVIAGIVVVSLGVTLLSRAKRNKKVKG